MPAADPSNEVRAHLQAAIARVEIYSRGRRSLQTELLDVIAAIGVAEHELALAKSAAKAFFRTP